MDCKTDKSFIRRWNPGTDCQATRFILSSFRSTRIKVFRTLSLRSGAGLPAGGRRPRAWTPDLRSVLGSQNAEHLGSRFRTGQRPAPVNNSHVINFSVQTFNQSTNRNPNLSQILKTAPHQRMRAPFICHLHGVFNQAQQLHCHLMDVQDTTKYTIHLLQNQTHCCDSTVLMGRCLQNIPTCWEKSMGQELRGSLKTLIIRLSCLRYCRPSAMKLRTSSR